ncbi:MAG: sulfatase [Candidatus Methanomethylicaceae archaeon]
MSRAINIILIVSDTFRYDLLRENFIVKNNIRAKTPNLDKFSKEAITFNKAYHASFPTVPNRHDLLIGRYTFTYYGWNPLPKDEIVLPQILRSAGYISVLITDTPHILKDGFNYDRGFDAWIWIRGQENDRYRTDPIEVKLPCKPEKLRGTAALIQHMRNNALRRFEEDWIPAKTAMEAVHWLERNYNRHFFLYIDFFDPHEPWDPPKWYIEKYDPNYEGEEVTYPAYGPCDYLTIDELTHCRALYAGEATFVDKWIGLILEKIEELGLFENTAIIFTSDHGFYIGEHGLIGKSIIKGNEHGLAPLYEEVAHIPLIIRLPDALNYKGKSIEDLVQTPDITATIIDLAKIKQPDFIEGKSLMPLIQGEKIIWRDIAISSPPIYRGAYGGLRVTITNKEYSLILASIKSSEEAKKKEDEQIVYWVDGLPRKIKPFGKIDTELYNLFKDPKQQENIIENNKDVAISLRNKFIKFLEEMRVDKSIIEPWLKCKIIDF